MTLANNRDETEVDGEDGVDVEEAGSVDARTKPLGSDSRAYCRTSEPRGAKRKALRAYMYALTGRWCSGRLRLDGWRVDWPVMWADGSALVGMWPQSGVGTPVLSRIARHTLSLVRGRSRRAGAASPAATFFAAGLIRLGGWIWLCHLIGLGSCAPDLVIRDFGEPPLIEALCLWVALLFLRLLPLRITLAFHLTELNQVGESALIFRLRCRGLAWSFWYYRITRGIGSVRLHCVWRYVHTIALEL